MAVAALSGCSSSGGDDKKADGAGSASATAPASDTAGASASGTPSADSDGGKDAGSGGGSDDGTDGGSGDASDGGSEGGSGGGTAPGGKHGRIDFTGSKSGGFDVTTSVGCAVMDGKLVAVTVPDVDDEDASKKPAFTTTVGDQALATLLTPAGDSFVKIGADGISGAKKGGAWTLTISGAKLGAADASGGTVTVNGTLTCTKVSGT
jgi:hypothetical protein